MDMWHVVGVMRVKVTARYRSAGQRCAYPKSANARAIKAVREAGGHLNVVGLIILALVSLAPLVVAVERRLRAEVPLALV